MPIFFLPSFNVTSFSSFQLFCFYSILFGNCPQLDIPKISSKFSKKVLLLIRTNSREHSDASRTQFDRSKGSKRSEQLERGETSVTKAKETSKRFLVSSLLEDATVCPTVCTTCSTRCDRATRPSRANLPSFAYAERDCRR